METVSSETKELWSQNQVVEMTDKGLPVRGNISFEGMKQVNEHGAEYWSARDLQPLLGYSHCIKPACVLKVPKPTSILQEIKPTRAPKESASIEFYGNELALCSAFLNAVDSFFDCSTEFFEGFFKKNSSRRQRKVEEAEANPRECIRELLFGYMQVIRNNDRKVDYINFGSFFSKGKGKAGL
jgi:hypothetical protein